MRDFKDKIRICCIDYRGSVCDGPGVRTVIFTQGCVRHCKGCHNKKTWDEEGGFLLDIDECVEEICRYSEYKRITISGGEPLLQATAVEKLVDKLFEKGFEIALYTSFDKEEVPYGILCKLTYLKTGVYIEELRTSLLSYIGSTNQIFEKINFGRN